VQQLVFVLFLTFVSVTNSNAKSGPAFGPYHTLKVHLSRVENQFSEKIHLVNELSDEIVEITRDEFGKLIHPSESSSWEQMKPHIYHVVIHFESSSQPIYRSKDTLQLDGIHSIQEFLLIPADSFSLDVRNYHGMVAVNLSKWEFYPQWKQMNSVKAFSILSGRLRPEFDVSTLYGFDLKSLSVPCLLNQEVLHFPKLERLEAMGVYSNFNQYLPRLENLYRVAEFGNRYDNMFETLHAERYYSILVTMFGKEARSNYSNLEELLVMIDSSWRYADRNKKKLIKDYLIYENDFPEYSGKTPENDTLFHGKLKRGKPKGLWTFKLKDQYPRNDREKHRIDFKKLPDLKTPMNGHWSLEYANGKKAIEGKFTSGKKNGEWRFYSENGMLRSRKIFTNDTLELTIVTFEINGNMLESRVYYASEDEIYQSIKLADGNIRLNLTEYANSDRIRMSVVADGTINYALKGESILRRYEQGTLSFNEIIKKPIIDKLYPEFEGKDLPFTIVK